MTRVLVTGGCGYIGSHAVKALVGAGYRCTVIDNLSTGFRDALVDDVQLLVGDLGDKDFLERALREHSFDAIMHFAASIIVPESVSDPLKYYRNNTVNFVNLLDVATKYHVKHLIFSSTASVYGNGATSSQGQPNSYAPFVETQVPAPESPYGTSKWFSERILQDTSNVTPLKHVILRYFNVAGADPDAQMGQRSPKATHLIKTACEAAVGKRDGLTIFGDDYDTPDGTCIRDYIHVCDLADAHVLALKYLMDGGESCVLNCGYGKGYSVNEVVDAINQVVETPLKVTLGSRRPGDAVVVLAEPKKIFETLQWKPRYQNIHTIVEHAYRWEKKLFNRNNENPQQKPAPL